MLRIGICDDVYDARLVLRSLWRGVLERRRREGQFYEFSPAKDCPLAGASRGGTGPGVLDMEMGELMVMETPGGFGGGRRTPVVFRHGYGPRL
jgi:hypothetical protein